MGDQAAGRGGEEGGEGSVKMNVECCKNDSASHAFLPRVMDDCLNIERGPNLEVGDRALAGHGPHPATRSPAGLVLVRVLEL